MINLRKQQPLQKSFSVVKLDIIELFWNTMKYDRNLLFKNESAPKIIHIYGQIIKAGRSRFIYKQLHKDESHTIFEH